MKRTFSAIALGIALSGVQGARADEGDDPEFACADDTILPAEAWLEALSTGWRPLREAEPGQFGPANERENARVIYYAFREAGYPAAIAFAAIVNAYAESALDRSARMDRVFHYRGLHYPNGTGAIGLFQLLPSSGGAGGPSGEAQGVSETFQGGRWAGTAWQARHHHSTPDARGRTYYDATDPLLNTQRIILEVERDGAALMDAFDKGASIAHLSYLFGRDIERPQVSTWYRRGLAADMLGSEVAFARHPERLFAPDSAELGFSDPYTAECGVGHVQVSKVLALAQPLSARPSPLVQGSLAQGSLVAGMTLLLVGLFRRF